MMVTMPKCKMIGLVTPKVLDVEGNVIYRGPTERNLFLDSAALRIAHGAQLGSIQPLIKVGTDDTPVQRTDKYINQPLMKAGVNDWTAFCQRKNTSNKHVIGNFPGEAGKPDIIRASIALEQTFDFGVLDGTVREVGFDLGISKKDAEVNAKLVLENPIVMNADNQLVIEYALTIEVMLPDAYQVPIDNQGTISQVTITPVWEPFRYPSGDWSFSWKTIIETLGTKYITVANAIPPEGSRLSGVINTFPFGDATVDPVGPVRRFSATIKPSEANFADGLIAAFRIGPGPVRYHVDPPIPKDETLSLTISWSYDFSTMNS